MLYTLGPNLFRGISGGDDTSTEFARIDGDPHGTVICCLPWLMPYKLAMGRRIVPRNFLACYEMPRAIVSSEPEVCVRAVDLLIEDMTRVFKRSRLEPSQLLVVGLSIGNAVATAFANRIGARLCSISSADRGDLTLWESPASRHVRELAETKGYKLSDFTQALEGLHTVQNLENIAAGSRFVVSLRDELIPQPRREGLIHAVQRVLPAAEITYLDAGHFGTMIETIRAGLGEPVEVQLARA